jgi:hypothetical protein
MNISLAQLNVDYILNGEPSLLYKRLSDVGLDKV